MEQNPVTPISETTEYRKDPITPIPESVEWRANQFEHSLTYLTTDGKKKEMAVEHLPGSERKVTFSTFAPGAEEPDATVILSVPEMKQRYEFLAKMNNLGLLDHS